MLNLTVTAPESGQKILKFLLRRTDGSKVFLFKLFRKGAIRVNGKREDRDYSIREGDRIESAGLEEFGDNHKFNDAGADIDIIYQDDDIIAADKDYQTTVHYASGIRNEDTLLEQVRNYLYRRSGPVEFITPLHRIDRNTGGVVLFAKNYSASKSLSKSFHDSSVRKYYHAILDGELPEELFIMADIVRMESKNQAEVSNLKILKMVPDKKQWLDEFYSESNTISATVLRPIRQSGGKTLAEIEIWTGRHHQIRAVCQAAGYPVNGDRKYGLGGKGQRLLCKRMVLEDRGLVIESRRELELQDVY